jgi:lipopolysaccharide transport system ATP-binding protein
MGMTGPLVQLEHCGLELPIYGLNNRSLKGRLLSAVTGGTVAATSNRIAIVKALNGINLELRTGSRLGLLGHNGAGKTSLLKLIAGIYEPTEGRVKTRGKIANLLDVTMGLDFEATGVENIMLKCALHGIRPAEARGMIPDIWEFSGLGDFMRMPVRVYSSGMTVRLAFAIATSLHADILLMDEWLGVGDADFAAQAEQRLKSMVDNASILVIASHNPSIIEAHCNSTITLEHGTIVESIGSSVSNETDRLLA